MLLIEAFKITYLLITFDSEVFKQLLSKIDDIERKYAEIARKAATPLGEKWMDIQEVCQELKISKRTLQYYREENLIPYSVIRHKIYYKASDIQRFLMSGYRNVKSFK